LEHLSLEGDPIPFFSFGPLLRLLAIITSGNSDDGLYCPNLRQLDLANIEVDEKDDVLNVASARSAEFRVNMLCVYPWPDFKIFGATYDTLKEGLEAEEQGLYDVP
jgi:hypothetical protein